MVKAQGGDAKEDVCTGRGARWEKIDWHAQYG